MKVEFKTDSIEGSHCYIYSEPYNGFFKEHGFLPPLIKHTRFCDFKSMIGTGSKMINNDYENINKSIGGVLLPIFPVVFSERVLYVQHTARDLELIVWTAQNHERYDVQNDPAKKVSIIDLSECKMRVDNGEPSEQVMKPSIDALTCANVPHWLGYVATVGTSSMNQTVVLKEDFKVVEEKILNYTSFLHKVIEEIYENLSEENVKAFLKTLSKLYEKIDEIVIQWIKQSGEEMDASFKASCSRWLKKYEQGLNTAGLICAEKELAERISKYCLAHKLTAHVPKKQNYRKNLLLETIAERIR